jgi:hypothetical protein
MPPRIFYNLKKFHIFRIFLIPVQKDRVLHQILLHSSIRIDIHSFAACIIELGKNPGIGILSDYDHFSVEY